MTEIQIIIVAFFVVGLAAFFFGIGLPITVLLGWLTYQWIGDQPDTAYAMVQAGLFWIVLLLLNQIYILGIKAYKRLAWRKRFAEYQAARLRVERAGLNWDHEMNQARLRYDEREKMYWNVGLSNQHDRQSYFSEKGDY